jgi:hypothetical protein
MAFIVVQPYSLPVASTPDQDRQRADEHRKPLDRGYRQLGRQRMEKRLPAESGPGALEVR